jgi:hypothetical protein
MHIKKPYNNKKLEIPYYFNKESKEILDVAASLRLDDHIV